MERKLKYIGNDSCDRPVYEDSDGTRLVDTEPISSKPPRLCTKLYNCFDGEPDAPIEYTRFKNDTFTFDKRVTWW